MFINKPIISDYFNYFNYLDDKPINKPIIIIIITIIIDLHIINPLLSTHY